MWYVEAVMKDYRQLQHKMLSAQLCLFTSNNKRTYSIPQGLDTRHDIKKGKQT
jgi:hypothetical protein